MHRYWLVAIGGGTGTLLRFELSEWIGAMRLWAPLAILVINVSGCFTISLLNFVSDPSGNTYLGPKSRVLFMVGFCGGYTTFSSFSLLSFDALRTGRFLDLWLNLGLSHVFCLLGIWLGYRAATLLTEVLVRLNNLLRS